MKKKIKKILVVLGGTSRERKVSLETGKACIKAIKRLGYKVDTLDPAKKQLSDINKKNIDLIFNALHGKDGEDGNVQSYFEYLKIPYTHSGVLSSMRAMDKEISKYIFEKKKILTPRYLILNTKKIKKFDLKKLVLKSRINYPLVIKPTNEGSSIGVVICKNYKKLQREFLLLKKIYKNLMIEQFIGGKEVQVAVMKGRAIGAIELEPKRSFYDYKAKYSRLAKRKHIMPANISKKNYNKVLKIAIKAHKALECRGVTRSDFKFFKEKFYLLEINTQPGMTSLSLVPEIARYKDISFAQLVKKIILDASINK